MTRQKQKNTQYQTNRVLKCESWHLSFEKPAFFYNHHLKGFRETIYFSRKKTITIRTHQPTALECTSEVNLKFLDNKKKDRQKVFLSWSFWKLTQQFCIKSIFRTITLFLYLWRYLFMCIACDGVNYEEIEIWSCIATMNHFPKL